MSSILASRPEAYVYAGARDPPTATELEELAKTYPGRIAIVKCVSADAAGNADLAKLIKEKHGRVDTVIANAGASAILSLSMTKSYISVTASKAVARISDTVLKTTVSEFQEHLTVCT